MDEQVVLQQAIAAVRAGRKAEARQLLDQILQANPRHEQAWLWMGAVVETDAERVRCLQQVLAINPDNTAARQKTGFCLLLWSAQMRDGRWGGKASSCTTRRPLI